ncbi:MAG: Crp/Fnr family transcriptional regulator [Chloroflexi bacterium]|nr:Crp/Fnr family transcriptional regulator [Chloroflexota bacterium]
MILQQEITKQEIADIVSRSSLFRDMTPEARDAFIANGRLHQAKQGTYFFHQGEPADVFYIIFSGEVKLVQVTPDGAQVILHYFGPGDGIGIIVVMGHMNYPASAEAVEDCQMIACDRETLRQLMLQYPQLALNSLELVARRFVDLQHQYQELSTQRVEQRIALAVLRLVRQFGKRIPEGILIDMPLSREDLAQMTGTNMYNVSRILRRWMQAGFVSIGRKRVVLCQPHQLVVISEGLP